jgi:hypothetical protein
MRVEFACLYAAADPGPDEDLDQHADGDIDVDCHRDANFDTDAESQRITNGDRHASRRDANAHAPQDTNPVPRPDTGWYAREDATVPPGHQLKRRQP